LLNDIIYQVFLKLWNPIFIRSDETNNRALPVFFYPNVIVWKVSHTLFVVSYLYEIMQKEDEEEFYRNYSLLADPLAFFYSSLILIDYLTFLKSTESTRHNTIFIPDFFAPVDSQEIKNQVCIF